MFKQTGGKRFISFVSADGREGLVVAVDDISFVTHDAGGRGVVIYTCHNKQINVPNTTMGAFVQLLKEAQ